ncbi:restriction endonuclease subunit S [Patescibacteria group bacterium]|nr:restriction endonuclease subunit S [Patescibacteria group bacterium]MBU4056348.1 restriction endonuclease subunit S [Patescibacteria group bacterium]MBU4368958.1 restriction endonuclease subunit S [Patescibacteria group bacterium]
MNFNVALEVRIQATNFDNKFNLNFENVAQRLITKDKFKKVQLKKDDILIEKSGGSPIQPVGRVAIFENDNENFGFSNFLQCFRVNKQECLPYYLFAYLKSIYNLGYMEYVQNQTTGIKNLIMEEYLSIPVLLPPLEIQKKIAEKTELYYFQAHNLQKEAIEGLEKAKKEAEKMIL